jgi:hypothetical protein
MSELEMSNTYNRVLGDFTEIVGRMGDLAAHLRSGYWDPAEAHAIHWACSNFRQELAYVLSDLRHLKAESPDAIGWGQDGPEFDC